MKRASGTGGIRKLSGKRKKPYQAVITQGREWKNGRIVQKQRSIGVYATRREAQAALEDFLRYNYNLDLRNVKFEDVYKIISKDFTKSVASGMQTAFNQCSYLHNKKLIDIRKADLDIVAEMNGHYSAETQHKIASLINRVFAFGLENDIIIKQYPIVFKETKETVARTSCTFDEIQTILTDGYDLIIILLYTGMRIRELLQMQTEDVFEENGILCFHVGSKKKRENAKKAKTQAGNRIIPVHSKIEHLINLDGKYIIEPHVGYDRQRGIFSEWCCQYGMDKKFHELRKTFSTYGKKCGMDDFYRRSLLGHKQEGITDILYTDALVEDLKRQIELLDYSKV